MTPSHPQTHDEGTSQQRRTVRVFILLGQSNMVGMGNVIGNEKDGTLEYAAKTKGRYEWLIADNDDTNNTNTSEVNSRDWKDPTFESKDIRYVFTMGSGDGQQDPKGKVLHNEWMTVKTCSKIGPEFGIAYELDQFDFGFTRNQDVTDSGGDGKDGVMILKSCIGNRSLGWDLLPPGSPGFLYEDPKTKTVWQYAGFKETPARWEKGTEPNRDSSWYAGAQLVGDVYRATSVLQDISTYFPPRSSNKKGVKNDDDDDDDLHVYDDVSYEVAGFFFWQGDKDRYDDAYALRYKQNLVRLIQQLRHDFEAPDSKFVLATLGQTSWQDANGTSRNDKKHNFNESCIFKAQMEVSKLPEFVGNVDCVYSFPYSQGGASNSHYGGNAETYMDIGQAMGRAMVNLLSNTDCQQEDNREEEEEDFEDEDGWVLVRKIDTASLRR